MCSQADDPTQHGDTLRAALQTMIDHHDALLMVSGGPPIDCTETRLARAALAASATDEGRPDHCPGCDGNHA